MPSLIDLINKFITEHGSAKIQEKHIALLKDEAALIEKNLLRLESENRAIKSENETLKSQKINLQKENTQLKEKLKAYEQPTHDELPKEQQDILILLAKSGGMNEGELMDATKRGAEALRFDFEELKEAGMIELQDLFGVGLFCNLAQEGRRYLKKNRLLI